jgi:predicted  nucleic acid-binding Zn-ribbon protein
VFYPPSENSINVLESGNILNEKAGLEKKAGEIQGRLVEAVDERDHARSQLSCLVDEKNDISEKYSSTKQEMESLVALLVRDVPVSQHALYLGVPRHPIGLS